jgi:hypothetical protein
MNTAVRPGTQLAPAACQCERWFVEIERGSESPRFTVSRGPTPGPVPALVGHVGLLAQLQPMFTYDSYSHPPYEVTKVL